MHVIVNGVPRELPPGARLSDLVPDGRGVAIALNGTVVSSPGWPTTVLRDHDRVEVVTAHQGG